MSETESGLEPLMPGASRGGTTVWRAVRVLISLAVGAVAALGLALVCELCGLVGTASASASTLSPPVPAADPVASAATVANQASALATTPVVAAVFAPPAPRSGPTSNGFQRLTSHSSEAALNSLTAPLAAAVRIPGLGAQEPTSHPATWLLSGSQPGADVPAVQFSDPSLPLSLARPSSAEAAVLSLSTSLATAIVKPVNTLLSSSARWLLKSVRAIAGGWPFSWPGSAGFSDFGPDPTFPGPPGSARLAAGSTRALCRPVPMRALAVQPGAALATGLPGGAGPTFPVPIKVEAPSLQSFQTLGSPGALVGQAARWAVPVLADRPDVNTHQPVMSGPKAPPSRPD